MRQKVFCVCRNADFAPDEPVIKNSYAHRPCHHERDDTAASVICLNTENNQLKLNLITAQQYAPTCHHIQMFVCICTYSCMPRPLLR